MPFFFRLLHPEYRVENFSIAAAGPPAAGSDLLTARAEPTGQVVPLALGFVGALPLTWLQRRVRMRVTRRRGPKDPPRG